MLPGSSDAHGGGLKEQRDEQQHPHSLDASSRVGSVRWKPDTPPSTHFMMSCPSPTPSSRRACRPPRSRHLRLCARAGLTVISADGTSTVPCGRPLIFLLHRRQLRMADRDGCIRPVCLQHPLCPRPATHRARRPPTPDRVVRRPFPRVASVRANCKGNPTPAQPPARTTSALCPVSAHRRPLGSSHHAPGTCFRRSPLACPVLTLAKATSGSASVRGRQQTTFPSSSSVCLSAYRRAEAGHRDGLA